MSLSDRLRKATAETKRKIKFAVQCGLHPKQLGSPFRSQPPLVQAILDSIDFTSAKHILEIGPGDGVITTPLLERTYGTVTAIEINKKFCDELRRKEPKLTMIEGDVSNLGRLLQQGRIKIPADYVINGVPLDAIEDLYEFLTQIRRITTKAYIQYSVKDRFMQLCQYFPIVGEEKIGKRRLYIAKTNATYNNEAQTSHNNQ